MAHTIRDKQKLLNRVRRIRGQVDGVERALDEEQDCYRVLQSLAACRGAINGLMTELIEGHLRFHIVNPDVEPNSAQSQAAQELIDIIKSYLK